MSIDVKPFLMFQGRAEEAIRFYVETLPDTELIQLDRYGPDGSGAEGTVSMAVVRIGGLTLMANDSPPIHDFSFTPSLSLFVTCRSEDELERLACALSQGGSFLMPPDTYGFSQRFAWVSDRFGVSWQLNLP